MVGSMSVVFCGCMVLWFHGSMVPVLWFHGSVFRFHGFKVLCFHGSVVPSLCGSMFHGSRVL